MTFLYRDIPLRHQRVNDHILHIYLAFFGLTKRRTSYNLYRILLYNIFWGLIIIGKCPSIPQEGPRLDYGFVYMDWQKRAFLILYYHYLHLSPVPLYHG